MSWKSIAVEADVGRHEKLLGTTLGMDRRDSGYYSTPDAVARFIARKVHALSPDGRRALDPCVGQGELAAPLAELGVQVDGFDILPFDVPDSIHFTQRDFLSFYEEALQDADFGGQLDLPYDYYVANPPYNCHEVDYIRANKVSLSRIFGDVGVHNMYSMFLSAIIACAKSGAAIGIITLDSFLTARSHRPLRRQILRDCAIHSLLLCPTDLFRTQGADVRTCILILQKGRQHQPPRIELLNRPATTAEFELALANDAFTSAPLDQITIVSGDEVQFVVGTPTEILELFSQPALGSVFRCVTGISTGDDKQYLSPVAKPGFSIPFYKNPGARKFYCEPNGYLTDDFAELARRLPSFNVRNRDILYEPGITCSSMGVRFSACYLPRGSTFGVNANIILNDEDAWWLLAYLNTHLVTFIVRGVLIRSNMVTSGYVSRIPIPPLSPIAKQKLAEIAREAHAARPRGGDGEAYVQLANAIVEAELSLSPQTIACLRRFNGDLIRST